MQVFKVGGAVRDALLGIKPCDIDYVVVGATPDDISNMLAEGYSQVGMSFPVFLHPVTGDEYALARVERKSGAGYNEFIVETQGVSLEEDLARRDLTVNSMAQDVNGRIYDPFNGLKDLHNQILRHTSAAFAEDPLRVLRLARFGGRFSTWSIANETVRMCQELCTTGELDELSPERIWVELEKGFQTTNPAKFIMLLDKFGALKHCKMLREIFGEALSKQQIKIASQLELIDKQHRLVVAIGILTKSDSKLFGANNRVKECFTNCLALSNLNRTATSVFNLLKLTKAFGEGQNFNDLVLCTMVLECSGLHPMFSSRKLMIAHHAAKLVNAVQYPQFSGVFLGSAIMAGRINAIATALNIPI